MNLSFKFEEYLEKLEDIRLLADMEDLALSINDSPENYRLEVLEMSKRQPKTYSQLINLITEISIRRKELDPMCFFPCVATDEYVETLPPDAKKCMQCHNKFQEGFEIVWKPCGQHTFCLKCWKMRTQGLEGMPQPYNAWCTCVGFKYI